MCFMKIICIRFAGKIVSSILAVTGSNGRRGFTNIGDDENIIICRRKIKLKYFTLPHTP